MDINNLPKLCTDELCYDYGRIISITTYYNDESLPRCVKAMLGTLDGVYLGSGWTQLSGGRLGVSEELHVENMRKLMLSWEEEANRYVAWAKQNYLKAAELAVRIKDIECQMAQRTKNMQSKDCSVSE